MILPHVLQFTAVYNAAYELGTCSLSLARSPTELEYQSFFRREFSAGRAVHTLLCIYDTLILQINLPRVRDVVVSNHNVR